MNTKVITIQLFILFLTSTFLLGQDVKEKLNNIEGEAKKIVITTENGDVIFEGEEAKNLLKKMKAKKHKKIEWISDSDVDFDFDSESDNVFIFESKDGDKHIIKEFKEADNVMIFKHSDNDIHLIDGVKKIKVKVEDENGQKTVTVITNEDGEEKTETFTGKEAEEYLGKMEDEHNIKIDIEEKIDGDQVWIHNSGKGNKIEKEIKVELEDGVKKVTVKTKKDGEEKVEVYEGDEADEFLESEKNDNKIIKIKELKKGDQTKIIIKELKKGKED